jgi:catechol 2,3-dioxygenase-like lactoylglutathione lyase family enzyme
MIKGLHHNAYRCRNSEETREFYEDFLGLRFVSAFEIDEGRGLHSFFEMDDGSCLAFFEVPGETVRLQTAGHIRPAYRAWVLTRTRSTACCARRGTKGAKCAGRSIMASAGSVTRRARPARLAAWGHPS